MTLGSIKTDFSFCADDAWMIFDTAQQYVLFWQDDNDSDEVNLAVLQKCLVDSFAEHLKLALE